MFNNIGGKIKALAKIIAWIGIVCSVAGGISVMFVPMSYNGRTVDGIIPGLLIVVIGSLLSWIGSWTMYGFGQIIENTDKLAGRQ